MNKFYLFYDFTKNDCFICLLDEQHKIIDKCLFNSNKQLIDIANNQFNLLLKKNNISWLNIKKIYFNNGPGNFTGLRVSCIFAKTVATIYDYIKINVINTLKLYCNNKGIAIWPSNNDLSYFAIYDNKTIYKPSLLHNEECKKLCLEYSYLTTYNISNLSINQIIETLDFNLFNEITNYLDLSPEYIKEPV